MRHARHGRKGGHIGSRRLEKVVEREYTRKGYSKAKATYVAGAVVGKVWGEQATRKRRGF